MKNRMNRNKQQDIKKAAKQEMALEEQATRQRANRSHATLAAGLKYPHPRFLVLLIDEDMNEKLLWLTSIPSKGDYIHEKWWPQSKEGNGSYKVLGVSHRPAGDIITQPYVKLDVEWLCWNSTQSDIFFNATDT